VGRYGARVPLLVSGVLITVASVLLTFLTTTTPVWALLIVFAVFGIGFSMVNAPVTNAAVSGMPLDRAGAASAVTSTSRQVGVSIGVALCGSVAGSALSHTGTDFAAAARPLWFVCAGLGLVITVLAFSSTSRRAMRSAELLAPLIAGTNTKDEAARVG
jgi:MFS family permease